MGKVKVGCEGRTPVTVHGEIFTMDLTVTSGSREYCPLSQKA